MNSVRALALGCGCLLGAACDHSAAPQRAAPSASASTSPTPAISSASAIADLHSELVSFPSDGLTLHGFMWKPPGDGPFPAIVYNHGSELLPGWMPDEAAFFVNHG